MARMRSLLVVIGMAAAMALSACVATSPVNLSQRDAEISQVSDEKDRQMAAEPAVVELRRKRFLGKDLVRDLEKLTSTDFPTEAEKAAIAIYYSMMSSYQQKYTDIVRRYNPAYLDIFELNKAAFTTLLDSAKFSLLLNWLPWSSAGLTIPLPSQSSAPSGASCAGSS